MEAIGLDTGLGQWGLDMINEGRYYCVEMCFLEYCSVLLVHCMFDETVLPNDTMSLTLVRYLFISCI